jgi:hypothetical protein
MAHRQRTIPIRNCTLSITDIRKLYRRLSACVIEEGERELATFVKPDNVTDEQWNQQKDHARSNVYKIAVTIGGADGSSLYDDNEDIFSSQNLPHEITYVFMTNTTAYQFYAKRRPVNTVSLNLDFSKPPLLDNNNPVSNPTPNISNLTIEGDRDTWLSGVADQVMSIVDAKKGKRGWLHAAFVYDAGLYLIGAPAALYLCWKLSAFVNKVFGSLHGFLVGAAYIYIFFSMVVVYRTAFGYTKWAFPTVELEEAKSTSAKHRSIWYLMLGGVGTALAYDLLRAWWLS